MAAPAIEEFMRLLITHVRDNAIDGCDISNSETSTSVEAIRWRQKKQAGQIHALVDEIIPDCVDKAIFWLLHAIDEEILQISFTSSSGETVNLTEVGESEMAGSYMGGYPPWIKEYSKKRFNDDCADLS